MKSIFILMFIVSLHAEVSGGLVFHPVCDTSVFNCENDNWPLGGADDNRTATIDIITSIDSFRIGVSYELFTKESEKQRIDGLSCAIGKEILPNGYIGLGIRAFGNIGGEYVQNAFHHIIGTHEFEAAYTDSLKVTPLVILQYLDTVSLGDTFGIYSSHSLVVHSWLEHESRFGLYYTGDNYYSDVEDTYLCIGVLWTGYYGEIEYPVINRSYKKEQGVLIEGALISSFIQFNIRTNREVTIGGIGIIF